MRREKELLGTRRCTKVPSVAKQNVACELFDFPRKYLQIKKYCRRQPHKGGRSGCHETSGGSELICCFSGPR